MLPRFLVADLDAASDTATVTGGEAHHLTRVLRLGSGDRVSVFDGRGREFHGEIQRVTGGGVVVRLLEPVATAPARQVPLTLAQAVLKGSSMDDVIRDAVMMGVEAVVPLVTAHTVAHKAAAPHGADRWRRVAVASAKQCRTARVPDVHGAVPFETWLGRTGRETRLLLVEPSVENVAPLRVRDLSARGIPKAVTLAVGPEGGWAAPEVEAAIAAGFVPVTLGPLTLRAEAVPLAALAALSVLWD